MGHTAVVPSAATFAWQTGLTTVYGPVLQTGVVGWNTHTFTTPFAWDGVQNVVIESCFNNLSWTLNGIFNQSTSVGLVTTKLYSNDFYPAVCTELADAPVDNRPNMRLAFAAPAAPAAPNWQVNQPNATMDFDFILATPVTPAIGSQCVGGLGLAIAWANVPYFGTAITNSFILSLDASGTALCDGLTGIAVGAGSAWFGTSAGNLGATDPGITTFTIGGPNAGPAGMGMLYNFGTAGTATAGINQLMLLPNLLGNYDWAAF
ncbi:MAG: hypothetical protein EXS14_02430 [Planctomycetes bacterium]|nr:hypothetical protein [Planctomycetota bacterium]